MEKKTKKNSKLLPDCVVSPTGPALTKLNGPQRTLVLPSLIYHGVAYQTKLGFFLGFQRRAFRSQIPSFDPSRSWQKNHGDPDKQEEKVRS